MKFYMLEEGDRVIKPSDLVHALMNPHTETVTDIPEEICLRAITSKAEKVRIVEFEIVKLARPLAYRPCEPCATTECDNKPPKV
jgi:hypothetical protein